MYDSPDGHTWTNEGLQYTAPLYSGSTAPIGEPSVYYVHGVRHLIFDESPSTVGHCRYTAQVFSPTANLNWYWQGIAGQPILSNSWESTQVFDGSVLVYDAQDGNGSIPHMFFAGGDNCAPTNATDSSIGLALNYSSVLASQINFPSTIFDDFTRADGTLNGAWVSLKASLKIVGNRVFCTQANELGCYMFYSVPLNNDQRVQAPITVVPTGNDSIGVLARVSSTTMTFYVCYYFPGEPAGPGIALYKWVSGSLTQLGSTVAYTPVAGDVLGIQAVGDLVSCNVNGLNKIAPVVDQSIPTGPYVGLEVTNTTASFGPMVAGNY